MKYFCGMKYEYDHRRKRLLSENNIDYCGMEITTTPYDFKK